jgi:hypothetical protein
MNRPDRTIKLRGEMTPEERVAEGMRHFPTLLARWRGGRARFWDYTVSHSGLVLRVVRSGVLGNLHINCSAIHICGPVGWENSDIAISLQHDGSYLIEDRVAGVRVIALSVGLFENVKPVYEGS